MSRAVEESNRRGTDCALRDPFGNHIRIGEPAPRPYKIPEPAAQAADAG